jgi:MFS family permease
VTTLGSPKAAAAVVLLFAYNGLAIGTYAAAIPVLQSRFALTPLQMSGLFVGIGLAAIASMQLSGRLSDRIGARRVCLAMIPFLIIGIIGIGQASNIAMLFGAGVVLGIGNGGIDVAMNAIGVQVEKHRPKPIMSFFHGMWSVGNLVGAAMLVALASLFGWEAPFSVAVTTSIAASIGVLALGVAIAITPETTPVNHANADTGVKTPLPAAVYLMGLMAMAFGLGEGTAMDWSGLHVTEVAGVDVTVGSLGVTVVAAFMVVIRLLGDSLVTRFGRRAVTRFGGACSAVGYFVVAIATPLPVLLIGWSLVGFGVGMLAPQVYAVAGHAAGGRGLAVVVTFGYATFLIAPALIGWLVSHVGIQHTMFLPAALLSGLLLMARIMPGPEPRPTV